jgi:hypothetical protein
MAGVRIYNGLNVSFTRNNKKNAFTTFYNSSSYRLYTFKNIKEISTEYFYIAVIK